MKVKAKCVNHSGCLRAYRGEVIELEAGAPLMCPECGKPLQKAGGGQGAIKAAAILVGLIVAALAAFLTFKFLGKSGGVTADAPKPPTEVVSTDQPPAEPAPSSTASTPTDTTPPPPTPAPPTPVDEAPPAAPTAANEPVTPDVRREVLARIDKMPNLSDEKKDRLYSSVQRARDMRKVVEIPFGSGQASMPASSADQVKRLLDSPEVMKFRDDLTAVFVVLGFADTQGDEKANLRVSEQRAESVVRFMERQAGIKNVTHAVGMGGTNLVDKNNLARNRVAEIWAVLP